MRIKLQLKDIVKNDEACDALGINYYTCNEGGDGEAWYEVDLADAIRWGLIPKEE